MWDGGGCKQGETLSQPCVSVLFSSISHCPHGFSRADEVYCTYPLPLFGCWDGDRVQCAGMGAVGLRGVQGLWEHVRVI